MQALHWKRNVDILIKFYLLTALKVLKIICNILSWLTHKQLKTYVYIAMCTVATDALVLKNLVIGIHSADQISIALDQFETKNVIFIMNNIRKWIKFGETCWTCLRVNRNLTGYDEYLLHQSCCTCIAYTVNPESYHDANFAITDGTGGCHKDNLHCHQLWKSWHQDNSKLEMNYIFRENNENETQPY